MRPPAVVLVPECTLPSAMRDAVFPAFVLSLTNEDREDEALSADVVSSGGEVRYAKFRGRCCAQR